MTINPDSMDFKLVCFDPETCEPTEYDGAWRSLHNAETALQWEQEEVPSMQMGIVHMASGRYF